MSEQKNKKQEDGATFDMYHFFSRKDVILAALVIVAFLIYMLFKAFTAGAVV